MKKRFALFFILLFLLMLSAPSILISIDNSMDKELLIGLSEEEEKEDFKLFLEQIEVEYDIRSNDLLNVNTTNHISKIYDNTFLQISLPPPKIRLS